MIRQVIAFQYMTDHISFCIEGTVQATARDESEVTGDIEIVQDAFGEDCRFGCRQHQDAPLPGCLF